ncbi:MAG: ArsR family transcriptional regulator [Thermodesulfobacteriota bacterium]|nr:MAG: ArsR family transcriptional regulator [Thermodesulfobacteriota bacterium]
MKLDELIKKLKALSDPTRLKILLLLDIRPCCVCELTQFLKLPQPTLSHHIQKLHQANLIEVKKIKNYQIYSFEKNDETQKLVKLILSFFTEKDPETLKLIKKVKNSPPLYPREFIASNK